MRELSRPATGPIQLVVGRGVERRTGTGRLECFLSWPEGPGDEPPLSIPTIDDTTTGQYVFAAAGADVTVTSLIVYGSPVACIGVAPLACPQP